MEALPYSPEFLPDLCEWAEKRGMPPYALEIPADLAAKTGLVVPGIAAMWLFVAPDSGVALIGDLIANPSLDAETREGAIRLLFDRLVERARSQGCHRIIGWTTIPAVLDRVIRYGGFPMGDQMFFHFKV